MQPGGTEYGLIEIVDRHCGIHETIAPILREYAHLICGTVHMPPVRTETGKIVVVHSRQVISPAHSADTENIFFAVCKCHACPAIQTQRVKTGLSVIAALAHICTCLLYTSDAADDLLCVDLGGR